MDKDEKDRLWAELNALGEDQVREKLGLSHYGGRRKPYVDEWLRQEELKRAGRHQATWHTTWWGQAIIAILIIVLAAALVSRLAL